MRRDLPNNLFCTIIAFKARFDSKVEEEANVPVTTSAIVSVSTNFAIEPKIKPIDAKEPNNITMDRCESASLKPVAAMPTEFKREVVHSN